MRSLGNDNNNDNWLLALYSAENGSLKSRDSTIMSPDPMISLMSGVKHVRYLQSALFATSIFCCCLV